MVHATDTASTTRVVCLGDPVLDILANVPYNFLEAIGATAGGCIAITPHEMTALLGQAGALSPLTRYALLLLDINTCHGGQMYHFSVAGGSAANVAKALACLLPQPTFSVTFTGMVGADTTAHEYTTLLRDRHVDPALVTSDTGEPTATCCCLVREYIILTVMATLGLPNHKFPCVNHVKIPRESLGDARWAADHADKPRCRDWPDQCRCPARCLVAGCCNAAL